eukprot:g16022.t1
MIGFRILISTLFPAIPWEVRLLAMQQQVVVHRHLNLGGEEDDHETRASAMMATAQPPPIKRSLLRGRAASIIFLFTAPWSRSSWRDSQELPKIGTQLFAPESTCCNCWIAWSMLLAYLQAENWPQDMRRGHCSKNMPQSEEALRLDSCFATLHFQLLGTVALMLLFGAGNAWSSVLGFCEHLEVAAAVPCCSETAAGPQLAIPSLASGSEGEAVLRMLAAMRDQLTALKEVCVHIAPPRLPRVTGETRATRSEAVSVLAGALSAALPSQPWHPFDWLPAYSHHLSRWWLDSFQANLRGGCLLAGDSVLADLVGAIPKHLTRLGLDLNHFSSTDAQAVARCLPSSLRELRLLFHGRSFAWLGSGVESNGTEETGITVFFLGPQGVWSSPGRCGCEELASALPASLEKLHLMLESSAAGASLLCQALPPNLVHLALDLQMTLATASAYSGFGAWPNEPTS